MNALLPKLLLLFVFLAGQWTYAAHDAASIDNGHFHSVDCAVCLTESQVAGVLSSSEFFLEDFHSTTSIKAAPITGSAVCPRHHSIRAPPVN